MYSRTMHQSVLHSLRWTKNVNLRAYLGACSFKASIMGGGGGTTVGQRTNCVLKVRLGAESDKFPIKF
jgi:hypothetical protein